MAERAQRRAPEHALTSSGRRYELDLLRAIASLAVCYVSLSWWFRNNGGPTSVTTWLDRWLITPAHLNQDLSFFGLALFFLVSGFVISLVATRETVPEFATKRLLRIFPGLAAATLLAWALVVTGHYCFPTSCADPGSRADAGLSDLLLSSVLANFFVPGHVALVGVAGPLVIQLAIYVLICALLPLYRREPWLVIGIEITGCAVLLAVVRNVAGLPATTTASIGAFGTAVVLGQVVWAVWTGRLPLWAGAGLGLGCWLVFLWGGALGYQRPGDSYPLTLFMALLIMVIALLAGAHLRPNQIVTWLATRSYPTYLLHQTVAFPVLAATLSWSRWLAGLFAIGCTFVLVEIMYRTVQRPAQRLGPALLRWARSRGTGHPPTAPPAETRAGEPATSGTSG